jgi:putative ABC transport system substrate-binding protein
VSRLSRLSRRAFMIRAVEVGASTAGLVVLGSCGLIPGRAPPKMPLIGYLNNNTAGDPQQAAQIEAFHEGLREQGLVEGQNLLIAWRFSEGQTERLPALVTELIGLGVRLIVTNGATATGAARQVTDRVPIVIFAAGDPVAPGWVASLARPGGNVTGAAGFSVEQTVKGVELLAAVAPAARRLAYLTNLSSVGEDRMSDAIAVAADQLGLQLLVLDVRTQAEIEQAFERARVWGAEALNVLNSQPFNSQRALVVAQVARSRLPASSAARAYVEAGLLMSFATDLRERGRRVAPYVTRILNGADPAELAIDRPTKFELVVNRTTLVNLGLSVPPDVAAQVTEWIE